MRHLVMRPPKVIPDEADSEYEEPDEREELWPQEFEDSGDDSGVEFGSVCVNL